LLTPVMGSTAAGRAGVGLYVLHNVVYTVSEYPAGALGDRLSKTMLLAVGYALFGVMCAGFLLLGPSVPGLVGLFTLAGLYIAIVDSMERALAADLLPVAQRGTGYGALAMVNSIGDLLSSAVVGLMWARLSYSSGFLYGCILTIGGALALLVLRVGKAPEQVEIGP